MAQIGVPLAVLLAGILFFSHGHSAAAAPQADAAHAAISADDQAVAEVLVALTAATFASNRDGVATARGSVVEPATFIHHMIVGQDSVVISRRPLFVTC